MCTKYWQALSSAPIRTGDAAALRTLHHQQQCRSAQSLPRCSLWSIDFRTRRSIDRFGLKLFTGTQHRRHYQRNFALCGELRYRSKANRELVSKGNVSAVRLVSGVGLVLLLVCALCAGQSLADAERQNRQQKETRGITAKKVYTTDDITSPACPLAQEPKDLSGTWSFTHFDDRFQGWIALCQSGSTLQGKWHTSSGKSEPDTLVTGSVDGTAVTLKRFLGPNQQSYALTLSADGNRLDGFGEGYFLHHTNLNMTRSGDAKPATAPPSTTSTASSAKH